MASLGSALSKKNVQWDYEKLSPTLKMLFDLIKEHKLYKKLTRQSFIDNHLKTKHENDVKGGRKKSAKKAKAVKENSIFNGDDKDFMKKLEKHLNSALDEIDVGPVYISILVPVLLR